MNIKKMSKIISAVLIMSTILSAFCAVFATPSIPSAVSPTTGAQDVNNVAGIVIYIIQIIAFAATILQTLSQNIGSGTASNQ